MAGEGSRFVKEGYNTVKPLIKFKGKTMIEHVLEPFKAYNKITKIVGLVRKEHIEKYNIDTHLKRIVPGIKIVVIEKLTEGAACSILLAEDYINNDEELAVVNCDNIIQFNNLNIKHDGKIYTFKDDTGSTKWSYVKLNNDKFATEVQEKNPISTHATAGLYLWKKGSDFVSAAKSMIEQNIRFNNEFYLAPVYNQNIRSNNLIEIEEVVSCDIVGTPDDLNNYLQKSEQTA
jgi:NDP-sugar pyrophosphorylase family protein